MRRCQGFTLIELLLVVAIVTILAGIAIGYSGNFRREEDLKETARAVVAALAQGRAEAVRRSTKVYVNFNALRVTAFIDSNGNYVWDPTETIIYQYPSNHGVFETGQSVSSTNLQSTNPSGVTTAIFDYQGYSQDYLGNPISALVCVKDSQLADARAVQLTIAGATLVLSSSLSRTSCP